MFISTEIGYFSCFEMVKIANGQRSWCRTLKKWPEEANKDIKYGTRVMQMPIFATPAPIRIE